MMSYISNAFNNIFSPHKNESMYLLQEDKDFLSIDNQIDLNLKQIDFYHSLYERSQNKFSFLAIIYSFICFYIIELIKYTIQPKYLIENYFYIGFFLILIFYLCKSINKTYMLLKPVDIAYLNQPQHFYKKLLQEYQLTLKTDDKLVLNEYIKTSYLNETEEVLSNNIDVFKRKSKDFYDAFKCLFITFIIYILLSSYVFIKKKDEKSTLILENYKEIINYKNSIMSKSEKPKVDPAQVIRTQPVMIKESINLNAEKPKQTKDNKEYVEKQIKNQ